MTDTKHTEGELLAWPHWPAEAPDVMLGGCLRLGARVAPVRSDRAETAGTTFTITSVAITVETPNGPQNSLAFVGVLTSTTRRERIRVDILCPVEFRPGSPLSLSPADGDRMLAVYGPWARHIIYDFAANEARSLAGPSVDQHDLPQSTPRVVFSLDDGPNAQVEAASVV